MAKEYEQITWLQALMAKWSDYCNVIGFITAKDGTKYAIPAVKALLMALDSPRIMRFCMGDAGWKKLLDAEKKREYDRMMQVYRKTHPHENSPEYKAWANEVYRKGRHLLNVSVKTDDIEKLREELRQDKVRLYRYRARKKVAEESHEAARIRKLESKIKAMKSGVK